MILKIVSWDKLGAGGRACRIARSCDSQVCPASNTRCRLRVIACSCTGGDGVDSAPVAVLMVQGVGQHERVEGVDR